MRGKIGNGSLRAARCGVEDVMLKILKTTENGLERLDALQNGCWVHITDPTSDEIELITQEGIPQDFLTYPLDMDELSRTEREDNGVIFILLRVPMFQGRQADVPYSTMPLGIVLTDRFVVTISRRPCDILEEFAAGRVRNFSTSKRNRFVLRVLLASASRFLYFLREINRTVEMVEDQLQASMRNNEVMELLKFQKSLVFFTTALKSNELMMERLQRSQFFRMYPDDEDLLEDVITENQQAIEMVNISGNILAGMMDAFASIISNNLNVVMKFLASVTIVMSIPTIITGFFGMNVLIPLTDQPWMYLAILGSILLVSILVIFIFIRRNWF
jgi:magnesium transporter